MQTSACKERDRVSDVRNVTTPTYMYIIPDADAEKAGHLAPVRRPFSYTWSTDHGRLGWRGAARSAGNTGFPPWRVRVSSSGSG